VELDSCDVFGGLYGDNVTAVIIEARAVPIASNVTPDLVAKSSGMDLLTERTGVDHVSSPVERPIERPVSRPVDFDPWSEPDEADGDGFNQSKGEVGSQESTEQDPWGDFGNTEILARSTPDATPPATKPPDSSRTEISVPSATEQEPFFLAPSTVKYGEEKEPVGSLGVTAETLLEVFSKHIVYREASGKLAFGVPTSDYVVDYHVYNDNGEEVNAYVCFINDKYSAGFAPKSERVSDLPKGKSSSLSYETIKMALSLCERQR
jgi:hypothetical protein